MPTKHKDSVLTRAYTSLNKASAQVQVNSLVLATVTYQTRVYGLACLAHVSLGVLDPNTFWNQVAKTAASYIKDVDILVGNKAADITSCMGAVSATFSELIEYVCRRNDKASFISGRGFLAFCEYWTSCAKRVSCFPATFVKVVHESLICSFNRRTICTRWNASGRIFNYLLPLLRLLKKLLRIRRQPGKLQFQSSRIERKPVRTRLPMLPRQHVSTPCSPKQLLSWKKMNGRVSVYCLSKAGLTIFILSENANCLEETLETMGRCTPFLRVAYEGADRKPDDDMRDASRVLRSFERMRRAAAKALDASKPAVRGAAAVSQPPRIATILLRSIDILGKFVNAVSAIERCLSLRAIIDGVV